MESHSEQWILIFLEFTLLPIWMLLQFHVSLINLILLISLLPLSAWSHECLQKLTRGAGIPHWKREGLEVIESQWEPLYQETHLNTIPFLRRPTYSVKDKGGLVQLDNSRDRLERRDGQSWSRALSSLKVEGISNLLYSALQHYGSDPIRSCLRARSYLMAGSLENGYLQPCLCSRQSLTLRCEEREIAWEIWNRQHKNFGKSSSLSTRFPFWFHWHHIHVDKHLMCLERERNVPDL